MKYYFSELNEEVCYTLSSIKDMMREDDIEELEVTLAKPLIGDQSFYCSHFHQVGIVGEGCGKMCEAYSPRNGKNGRCRHSGHCYEPTGEKRIIKLKG